MTNDALPYDQRGALFHRVFDGNSNGSARIDIGSYESQPHSSLGDYNLDGGVNAADYVMWRKLFGTSAAPPFVGADGDGDSSIDPGDYNVWQDHFGETIAGAGSSVGAPELHVFGIPAVETTDTAPTESGIGNGHRSH
jgi:hypothetical protein